MHSGNSREPKIRMCAHIKSTLQFIQLSSNVSFKITLRKTENMFNMMSEFCLIDNKITSVTPQQHNIMNMFQSEKIHLTKDQLPTCCLDILYHYTIDAIIFNVCVNKTYD